MIQSTYKTDRAGLILTDSFFLILSCFFISFLNAGTWLVIPFLNGTIAFGISIIIAFLALADYNTRYCFWHKQYGYGIIVLMILYFAFMKYNNIKLTESRFLSIFYCFVIMLIAAYINNRIHVRKPFCTFLLFELLLKAIINITAVIRDPSVIRNSGFAVTTIYGVGSEKLIGIPVLYSLAVLAFVLLSNFKFTKYKVFSTICIITIIWLLYIAQLTLLLLTTLVMILFMFFINPKHYQKAFLIVIAVGIILFIFLPNIIQFVLAKGIFGSDTRNRLQEVYSIFYSDKTFGEIWDYYSTYKNSFKNSSVQGRLYSYIKSIQAFSNNFFTGSFNSSSLTHGGHSIWLDTISDCGFLVLIFYYSIVKYIKGLIKTTPISNRKAIICFFVSFSILGIINYFSITNFCIQLYIILPYFYTLFIPDSDVEGVLY